MTSVSNIKLGNFENYEIIKMVGKGKYAIAYKGIDVKKGRNVLIKVMKDISDIKIGREVDILKKISGVSNTGKLIDVLYDPYTCVYSLVFEYYKCTDFYKFKRECKLEDVKCYMKNVLLVLSNIHKKNIIHRDVKPQNVLVDDGNIKLIDFGAAVDVKLNPSLSYKTGCLFYNAPELILKDSNYGSAIDIWALGCIFAELLSKENCVFGGKSRRSILQKLCLAFGYNEIKELCNKYNLDKKDINSIKLKNSSKLGILQYVFKNDNSLLKDPQLQQAFDLLEKMLEPDYKNRITADQALKHKYFN